MQRKGRHLAWVLGVVLVMACGTWGPPVCTLRHGQREPVRCVRRMEFSHHTGCSPSVTSKTCSCMRFRRGIAVHVSKAAVGWHGLVAAVLAIE